MHDGQKWVQEGKELTIRKHYPDSANGFDILNPLPWTSILVTENCGGRSEQ